MSPLILLGSVFRIPVLAGGSANFLHACFVILVPVVLFVDDVATRLHLVARLPTVVGAAD